MRWAWARDALASAWDGTGHLIAADPTTHAAAAGWVSRGNTSSSSSCCCPSLGMTAQQRSNTRGPSGSLRLLSAFCPPQQSHLQGSHVPERLPAYQRSRQLRQVHPGSTGCGSASLYSCRLWTSWIPAKDAKSGCFASTCGIKAENTKGYTSLLTAPNTGLITHAQHAMCHITYQLAGQALIVSIKLLLCHCRP